MNKPLMDIVGSILSVIFGLCFSIFHKILARWTAESQYKFWHIRYSENTTKITSFFWLVLGVFFLIFGILHLTGIWKFK